MGVSRKMNHRVPKKRVLAGNSNAPTVGVTREGIEVNEKLGVMI